MELISFQDFSGISSTATRQRNTLKRKKQMLMFTGHLFLHTIYMSLLKLQSGQDADALNEMDFVGLLLIVTRHSMYEKPV